MATQLETQTALVKEYLEVIWNKKDLGRLSDFISSNCKFHSPLGDLQGIEPIKNHFKRFQSVLQNLKVDVEELDVQNDHAASILHLSATCKDDFFGIKVKGTKKVDYDVTHFCTITDNKITKIWVLPDMLTLLKQLGVVDIEFKS